MDIINLFQEMFASPFLAFIFFFGYTWVAKTDGVDTYEAAHVNLLQNEKLDRDGEIPATGTIQWDKGSDIPSANTLVPGDDGNYFDVTGTTAILEINAAQSQPGTIICLHFDAILTLTHDATDLILPGGANITTAAGDEAIFIEYTADKWRCVCYTKADGTALVAVTDKISEGDSSVEVVDAGTGYIETKADNQQVKKDQVIGNIQPLQPAFNAYSSATDSNKTGDGTLWPLEFDTELFDQGGNFAPNTFTAPVTGKYLFCWNIYVTGLDVNMTTGRVRLVKTGRTFYLGECNPAIASAVNYTFAGSIIVSLAANDTVSMSIEITGGAKTVDIEGSEFGQTWFSGALIC